MPRPGTKTLFSALVLALAACGNTGEPFRVLRVSPEDGYQGFQKGDVIEVAFNAPVNEASLSAAYRSESEGLKPGQVTFTLLEDGYVLQIAPKNPLPYSPDESRLHFRFILGTELTDRHGRHLAAPLSVTFSTLRTRRAAILSNAALDGIVAQVSGGVQYQVFAEGSLVAAGDGDHDEVFRGFLAFPWPKDLVEPLAAELRLYSPAKNGSPFQNLGKLAFELMDLGDRLSAADFLEDPLIPAERLEDGSGFAVGQYLTYELGSYAVEAFARGLGRLDLRLAFETGTNGDQSSDATLFYAREAEASVGPDLLPTLFLTYLAP